jgi:hypothetical protein
MAKYLKITPPNGFAVVVPDSENTRQHYERLNEIAGKNGIRYEITEASATEVAAFNPVGTAGTTGTNAERGVPERDSVQIDALKAQIEALTAGQTEIDALKAKIEALTATIAASAGTAAGTAAKKGK